MTDFPPRGTPRRRTRRGRTHYILVATALATALALWGLIPLFVSTPSAQAATPAAISYQAPDTPSPSVAGATTPFTTYQAPEAVLGGGASVVSLTSAPTSKYDTPQGEATGHAYVQLTGTGQSVQWTNNTGQPINFVNVRASIPDSSTGGGITATLDLYVNGTFRQAIAMNSRQTWEYEGTDYNGTDQNPADGNPRDFWDDFHASISGTAIPAGATFSLQQDSSNTASFYWINSIDLWNAPAPAAQPANSISITSCGATADNTPTNGSAAAGATDSTVDIQNCISQAESKNETLWIPLGTFYLIGTSSLSVNNITVEGAGYWYSEIYRDVALPNNSGLGAVFQCTSCRLANFHIDTNAQDRNTADGGGGAADTTGTDWTISGMWEQHVESTVWASGSGGTVSNNFFTDIFADGCNLNNVSLGSSSGSNLTATDNFIRGTGDDGMAINSVDYNTSGSTTTYYTAMSNITMSHNTVLGAWGGQGMAIYGGSGQVFADNYIADTSRFVGLGVGRFSSNGSDMLGATVTGNVIVRAGGDGFDQEQPAMMIGNVGNGTSSVSGATGTVTNATVTGNTIVQPVYDGIGFSASTNTKLSDNTVLNPWLDGIVVAGLYYPSPTGNATLTRNSVSGLTSGHAAYSNTASGFATTLGGNSWQNTDSEGAYGGGAAAVPGTVQAGNYDAGGQGVAYNVTSINGSANSYRTDEVDLESCTDGGSSGCGVDLGWTASDQWLRYTVNVASAGAYTVSFRVASANGVTDAFHLLSSSGAELTGAENIPATGGWQTWTTVTDTVDLSAGQQTLILAQDNGGWNLRYLSFAPGVDPQAWYEVVNLNSNSCADDTGFGTANGTTLQQWSCGGATNQQWQFVPTDGGYYSVLSRYAAAQDEVWDVTGGPSATTSGASVQLWSNGLGTNQQWLPVPAANGTFTLKARNSGLCLTVPGSSSANGVQLQVETCDGSNAQEFRLAPQS